MLNVVKDSYKLIYNISPIESILYSENMTIDIDNLKLIFKNNNIRPKFSIENYSKDGMENKVNCVKRADETLWVVNKSIKKNINTINDIADIKREMLIDRITLRNSSVNIQLSNNVIDKHNMYDINSDIVSIGNMNYQFGNFMQGDSFTLFINDLMKSKSKLLNGIVSTYASILVKSNFKKIIGYAHVGTLYGNVTNVDSFKPLNNAKYGIMMNDYPMSFNVTSCNNNGIIVDVDLNGKFIITDGLPKLDPHILLLSKKSDLFPTIPYQYKMTNGNKTQTIIVYIGILNFPKPEILKNNNYTFDLLT